MLFLRSKICRFSMSEVDEFFHYVKILSTILPGGDLKLWVLNLKFLGLLKNLKSEENKPEENSCRNFHTLVMH